MFIVGNFKKTEIMGVFSSLIFAYLTLQSHYYVFAIISSFSFEMDINVKFPPNIRLICNSIACFLA